MLCSGHGRGRIGKPLLRPLQLIMLELRAKVKPMVSEPQFKKQVFHLSAFPFLAEPIDRSTSMLGRFGQLRYVQLTHPLETNEAVDLNSLYYVDPGISFRDLFRDLNARGTSGFILSNPSAPGYIRDFVFVYAQEFANAAINLLGPDFLSKASEESVARVFNRLHTSSDGVLNWSTPVFLGEYPFDFEPTSETGLFLHIDDTMSNFMWYLNSEFLSETATKKTVFVCTNDHKNPDPDSGTCYKCPFPIVKAQDD